jgi:hypothetical protein
MYVLASYKSWKWEENADQLAEQGKYEFRGKRRGDTILEY